MSSQNAKDLPFIPFTKVTLTGNESRYLNQALESLHLQGDGPIAKSCEALLERITRSSKVLLTSSGTDALEMAAILANIGPGDEVIMPSFTFVSTANAVVLRHAVPVFVDIRPDTLNLDESKIEAAITSKTKAIMPVHYAGFGCDMNKIMDIAKKHRLFVIEDAAHGAGAFLDGKHLGAIGHMGILSFHQTKNIVAGEGGALLINDPALVERAEILREKGTNRRRFLRGEVDKYTWVDVGSSFLPGELTAAVLLAQLESMNSLNQARTKVFDKYQQAFMSLHKEGLVGLPTISVGSVGNGHKFYLITRTPNERVALRDFLKARNIQAVSHYEPLHNAPAAEKFARSSGNLNVTEDYAARILRLPLYADISESDQDRVISTVLDFYC